MAGNESTRKKRSSPRTPSRERGIERYEALLDSVDALLQTHDPDDIGLYQIAEHAEVPSASIYHFFPTKDAAFLGLVQRYLKDFEQLKGDPIPDEYLYSWQGVVDWDLRRSVDFYRRHEPAMKLFLGQYGGIETSRAEAVYHEKMASQAYRRLERFFEMPKLRDPAKLFYVSTEIVDAVLSISYLKFGMISEEYHLEAFRAAVAYCRLMLPEITEPKRNLESRDEAGGEDAGSVR